MTIIENSVQLNILLSSIEMRGTRFAEWRFGWQVTPMHEPLVAVDVETADLSLLSEDPPVVAAMPGTRLVGWHIQCSFERPDTNDGSMAVGYGRKWWVEVGALETGVVFTAWLAIQQIIIHELHESFTVTVDGERVRLLDPHKELRELAMGSRRVE